MELKTQAQSKLIINSGTFNVTCENNAIAGDGSLTINIGTFNKKHQKEM